MRRGGLIERPRLLEKLQAAVEHRLTLISAPPGYGKTTLAVQFARQSAYPVAWHTIEQRERDIPTLHARSIAALETVVPGISALKPPAEYIPGDLAALTVDYLRAQLTGEAIYILDDVQHLTGALAAEDWLRNLVSLLPSNCHLVLISRTMPDLPLSDLIMHHDLLTLGPEDLRFSFQEIDQLASAVSGRDVPSEHLHALETRLEGWPAGMALAFYPLPPAMQQVFLQSYGGPEALFETLAQAMIDAQPSDIQDFLLASSTLSGLTPERCVKVLGLPQGADLLADIQDRNLFVNREPGKLSFHPLFRDLLQRRLCHQDPARFVGLHAKAAQYHEGRDEADQAFDHYLAAGLPEYATAIAERLATVYFTQGRVETLLAWEKSLRHAGQCSANLLYSCAMVHIGRYAYDAAEACLDEASAIYRARGDEGGLANVDLQRAWSVLQRGQYPHAAELAQCLLDQYGELTKVKFHALYILGSAHLYPGQAQEAIQYLEEALPLYRANSDAFALSQLLLTLWLAYSRLGRLEQANTCLQEVVALRRALGGGRVLAMALNNLGYAYHRAGQYDQAIATLEEGLSVVARFPERRSEGYLLWSLGDVRRDTDAFDDASKLYRRALERLGNGEPLLRCSLLTSLSVMRRWQGQCAEAETLALEAFTLADKHNLAIEGDMAQAALWAARIQSGKAGKTKQVRESLDALASDLADRNAQYERMLVLGLNASAALLGSRDAAAQGYLRDAVRLADEVGTAQALAAEAVHSPHLLALVGEGTLLARDVARLQAAQMPPKRPARPERSRERLPFNLHVRTLGQEAFLRDGQAIPVSAWRGTNAREMFLYLLFVGPILREAFSAEMWPEGAEKQVRSNFHSTLHNAREAVGADTLMYQDGLFRLNPAVEICCDALQFEHLVVQARLCAPHDARAEDLWRKAIDLYRGTFLPGLDADWIRVQREKLQELHLEALIGTGECAQCRRDLPQALDYYRRVLSIDPYREDVHRAILGCHAERGEKHKVRSHLRDLELLLRRDLGAELSTETQALASRLLQ